MTAGLAYFTQGTADGTAIPVHFNPTSLRVALTNQFGEDPPEQHARATTAKLDVELLFDTTHDGSDVRSATAALRALAVATGVTPPPSGQQQQANGSLPKAFFHWGTTCFEGLIESLTETLDFWSSDGVPLRASITLSMKGSELKSSAFTASAMATNVEAPALVDFVPVPAMNGMGASGAAAKGGDPGAGRFLAALNGMESMRGGASAGASLSASASINLSAAAGFSMSGGVSAGASAGFSAGAGIGFGAGASAGASASAGLSASVGVGMAAGAGFSAGASAGAGFSAGASAGAGFSAGAGASFGASAGASAGFGASAGASFGASASASGLSTSSSFSRSSVSYGGSASAGVSASQGAFAALGSSKTTLPAGGFSLDKLLPPPAPAVGPNAQFDSTGKVVSAGGQVAASYTASASAGVTFF
ncbi:MAG TPA: hypothetical protein VFQ67_07355 [Allosphingosinicella sp.]|jgi:hypothetical protein|nr:hypothetical protein [Allosphingosinicella sp.]